MSVTTAQLSGAGPRGRELDGIVREQLQLIDDKLLRTNRAWGRNVVPYELPVCITLGGLEKKDAQRVVYFFILRNLEHRGFETRLLLENDTTTLYIAWAASLDQEAVETMNELIRKRRICREDVPGFIAGTQRDDPEKNNGGSQG